MGGDEAPVTVVAGACLAARSGVPVVLVGDSDRISSLIAQNQLPPDAPLRVVHTDQAVSMTDAPLAGLRQNPDSSIRLTLDAVAKGEASAAVSFGNSGAAVVEAVRTLRLLDGVERPVLAVALPTRSGREVILLDVGANVDVGAEQLAAFATLGLAWSRSRGVAHPRLAVLSNGQERTKGNAVVRGCLDILAGRGLEPRPIEPGAMLDGECDVVVCDGFVGNVLIKGFEAALDLAAASAGAHANPPSVPVGALVLGVDGVVLVGHGASGAAVVHQAIARAASIGGAEWVGGLVESLNNAQSRS